MPPKMITKAVPRTYGEGENFELYMNHFKRIAAANGWDEQAKMAYLETKLTGRAQREFEVFIEEDPDISFADIVDKLTEELVPSPQKALELFTQMRLGDKSPKEYYGALVRQSKLAHGDMDNHARHIIVRTQMLQMMPKKLRKEAALQGYLADMAKEDFLELLTRVYDAEMRDEVTHGSAEASYEPTISRVQASPVTVEHRLEALEAKETKMQEQMTELMGMMKNVCQGFQQQPVRSQAGRSGGRSAGFQRSGNQSSNECYRCLKEGHYARDCPNAVTCSKCREEGHVRSACPKN